METQELITIIQAAQISGKSIQTIRRMIKHKKIRVRKQRTPQGFNYLIVKDSIIDFVNETRVKPYTPDNASYEEATIQTTRLTNTQRTEPTQSQQQTQSETAQMPTQETTREHRSINQELIDDFKSEMGKFNTTIQKLVEQNQSDKSNFFELIKTFQDRIIILENQIKQLEAPKPSRWKFWA